MVLLDEVASEDWLHGEKFAIALELGAAAEDGFGRAFGEQLMFVVGRLDEDGHHPARKIKGDFVHFAVLVNAQFSVGLAVFEDGAVEDVFEAGLEVADEVRI